MKILLLLLGTTLGFRCGKINMNLSPTDIVTIKTTYGNDWSNLDLYLNNIDSAAILQNQKTILFSSDGIIHRYNYLDAGISDILSFMDQNHINYQVFNVETTNLLEIGIQLLFSYFIISTLYNVFKNSNSMMLNVKNKYDTLDIEIDTKFEDVAGIQEVKTELLEIVDYLQSPDKYTIAGARVPKGILLEGPPGTGKTLIARAVAGEAGVSFISATGSSFIEMFVGVGASRVRSLFETASKNKPCVIFIDEIDAIGGKRGYGFNSGGNDEREQTLNQLLTNMDGFDQEDGIIILAATNRADTLDPALKRSGRFDRKIKVNLPDFNGRKDIFSVHTKNKFVGNISLDSVARLTSGFSGADLENLANEACLLSIRLNKTIIDDDIILKAFEKIVIGLPKEYDSRSTKTKMLVSVHETGHAMMVKYFSNYFILQRVTINSNNAGSGGYTLFTPIEEISEYPTKGYFLAQLIVALGGRAAEIVYFKNNTNNDILKEYDDIYITAGASNDLKQANVLAREYFKLFEDYSTEELSDITRANLDAKVKDLIELSLNKAISIIEDNKISFDSLINLLLIETTLIF
jgi:cell division protease FtsH